MAMKTACCGKSLRSVALTFLYFNLILNVWGLLSQLANLGDSSYRQIMQEYGNLYFDTILMIIAILVFLFTIISISREKPSFPLLTASIVLILFDSFYMIYGVIRLNSGDGLKKAYYHAVEKDARLKPEREREQFRELMGHSYSLALFLIYALVTASLAFKFYSALVFYSYKVDLQSRPVYSVPVRQNPDDKEMNPSAPAPAGYNVQYNASPYPSQPVPYPQSVPAQYPGQILQYPSQPQPYPPQYPAQPPQYPSLPPQYTIETK